MSQTAELESVIGAAVVVTEPGTATFASLEAEIATLSAHLDAATYRLLCCIQAFDQAEMWAQQGFLSCAAWLNYRVGLDPGAAREKVRVARALPGLPKISAAFSQGLVSYSKVRAMSRIATAENEAELLMIAQNGTARHVEKLVRAMRRVESTEENAQALLQQRLREVQVFYDDEGMLVIHGRLPSEEGAMLVQALAAARDRLWQRHDARGSDAHVSDADALLEMARQVLSADSVDTGERYTVVVHVDQEVLQDPTAAGRCHIEEGTDVAAETARRLACDASDVTVRHADDGSVLDVGRRTRRINSRLRLALRERDGGHCQWPGCDNQVCDIHHLKPWAEGGETNLANLTHLCRRHHVLSHEGGFRLEVQADGHFLVYDQNHQLIPPTTIMPKITVDPLNTLIAEHERVGIHIDAIDGVPLWHGETFDDEYIVASLLSSTAHP